MGLAEDLDYHHAVANPAQLALRWIAGTRPGGWVFSRTLRHADRALGRLTSGRHTVPSLLTGISVLTLTTTGRTSGARRTTSLIATPHGDALALLGTNFGQKATPAWALNLVANPEARVTFRQVGRDVMAREASLEEAEQIFAEAATFYVGYGNYRHRIGSSRRVRVFILEPRTTAH